MPDISPVRDRFLRFVRGTIVIAFSIVALAASLPPAACATTFTVNSTLDASDATPDGLCNDGNGNCTLRAAIEESNAIPGHDVIQFAIGPATIRPLYALPNILSTVTIDGTTAPGYLGVPLIEIDGSLTPPATYGFDVHIGPATIKGLVINRFRHAVFVRTAGCEVSACYIGTNFDGSAAAANSGAGIRIQDAANARITGNVISGNATEGVLLTNNLSANTKTALIADNIIGLDATGGSMIPNGPYGILLTFIIGSGQPGASEHRIENNVISGNAGVGVAAISSSNNVIVNNYIGTDRSGLIGLGNGFDGVGIQDGSVNVVRNNVISSNGRNGVTIQNYLPPSATAEMSAMSSVLTESDGATLRYAVAAGLVGGDQESVGANALTDAEATTRTMLTGSATENIVDANLIGTDKNGTGDLGNVGHGVRVSRFGTDVLGASNNTIGGPVTGGGCTGPCNVIAGNRGSGVVISQGATGNLVQGNYIGVRRPGTSTLGNWEYGVLIGDASSNTIGSAQAGYGNLIGGNRNGVGILGGPSSTSTGGANQNKIRGNAIGTDFGGLSDLRNIEAGVLVSSESDGATVNENDIGRDPSVTPTGTCTAGCNRIHYNGGAGIRIEGPVTNDSHVYANWISGNTLHGFSIAATGTIVGGSSGDLGNVISYNSRSGVYVESGVRNQIRNNQIRGNAFLGIDLVGFDRPASGPLHGQRITPNDPLDEDTGPNNLQNLPILTDAIPDAGTTRVKGYLRSAPNASYVVDFYLCNVADPSHFGEAESIVDHVAAFTTDAQGYQTFEADLPFEIPSTTYITATATDALGNTSEFSQALATVDTDEDAILDIWEREGWGIDINSDGVIDLDLYLDGARYDHKDVYVEVDCMEDRAPYSNALPLVVQAFARAPNTFVENPDAQPGIRLVARLSDTHLERGQWYEEAIWPAFHSLKRVNFGDNADRLSPNRAAILDAKRHVYRYCVFADVLVLDGEQPVGLAESSDACNDFIVSHGALEAESNTAMEQAETFMHELGHTLGLDHGGDDPINHKPNFLSVMNYAWGYSGTWSDELAEGFFGARSLTYCFTRDGLPDLQEDVLDENVGLGVPSTHPTGEPGFPITMVPFTDHNGNVQLARVEPNFPVDWRRDRIPSSLVSVNLNNFDVDSPSPPGETLRGNVGGWHTLQYNFRSTPSLWNDPPPTGPWPRTYATQSLMGEPTVALLELLDAIPPPRPEGHFEMDGVIDPVPQLATDGTLNLYGAYTDGQLYVASSSAASVSGDVFVLVAENLTGLVPAPGGHSGQAGAWLALLSNTPNGIAAWSNAAQVSIGGISVDSSAVILEGVVDIELLLGREPEGLAIAVGKYDPSSGGALLAQVPSGDGDANLDLWEFYRLLPPPPTHWPASGEGNVPICTVLDSQEFPHVVSDGAGGAFIAWVDYRGTTTDLYAQHVLPTGAIDPAWPLDGRGIARAPQDQGGNGTKSVALVADGEGGAFIAWEDGRSGNDVAIYAQHLLTSGVDPQWPLNGSAVSAPGTDLCSNPTIVASDGGSAIVTWSQTGGFNGIQSRRLLSNGATDPSWPVGGLVLRSSESSSQHQLAMIQDGAGGAVVSWNVDLNGIYAQHVLVDGTLDPAWPSSGAVLYAAGGAHTDPAMVQDGNGGAIVAWGDNGGFPPAIRAQRVMATGIIDPAWPVNGRAMSSQPWWNSVDIVSDGAGGAIVAWASGFFQTDIYAQRVLSSGALDPAWPADGRVISFGNPTQMPTPVIATDASGGAIVTWTGGSGIGVHHVLPNGELDPDWPVEGRTFEGNPWTQSLPAIAADGAGGAIIAWKDRRHYSEPNNFSDIYAQRLDGNGVLGGVVVAGAPPRARPTALALEPVSPNPSRDGTLEVRFALATSAPATLELIDVAGRRVVMRDVGALGVGRHSVDLGAGRRFAPGVYFVRLRQAQTTRTTRVVVLD